MRLEGLGTKKRFEFAKLRKELWDQFRSKQLRAHHSTIIYPGAQIGEYVYIGPYNVIGHPGFGYAYDDDGKPLRIGHNGGVIIGDGVEIGCFTTVCRGTIDNTIIGEYTVIDDFVHVAHNAQIGKYCTIVARSEIGGNARIGDRVWLGQGCIIKNQVKVADGCLIGSGAVVLKDTEPMGVYAGVPAKRIRDRKTVEE